MITKRIIRIYGALFMVGVTTALVPVMIPSAAARRPVTSENAKNLPYTLVVTPNGTSLPWKSYLFKNASIERSRQ